MRVLDSCAKVNAVVFTRGVDVNKLRQDFKALRHVFLLPVPNFALTFHADQHLLMIIKVE